MASILWAQCSGYRYARKHENGLLTVNYTTCPLGTNMIVVSTPSPLKVVCGNSSMPCRLLRYAVAITEGWNNYFTKKSINSSVFNLQWSYSCSNRLIIVGINSNWCSDSRGCGDWSRETPDITFDGKGGRQGMLLGIFEKRSILKSFQWYFCRMVVHHRMRRWGCAISVPFF